MTVTGATGPRPTPGSALALAHAVLDPGTFVPWDLVEGIGPLPPPASADPAYLQQVAQAQRDTGLVEAVLAGEGVLDGHRVAVVATEFRFLAGSIGVVAAELLVRAVERATALRLPLVASPASGGTRMQEGTVAFLQMLKITEAVDRHKAAGLPYLVHLRSPTTGGVLASWGSLGHVTVAEPGALLGFLGPRVQQAVVGRSLPPGVQTAENLAAHGVIDGVVPTDQLAEVAGRALAVLSGAQPDRLDPPAPPPVGARAPVVERSAWECIERTRDPARPGVRALLRLAAQDVTPLSGSGAGERSPGLLLALARLDGVPCVVVAQDRDQQKAGEALGPDSLRVARRGVRLACQLRLPLVTVVDAEGAALSTAAEEGGLAGEIARTLAELLDATAPTVTLLLGEGAGGAALALAPGDRVVAAQHAWLAPLPPEGAAALLLRDPSRAPEVAERLGLRAVDLQRAGVVDQVVPELPDAADEPEGFSTRVAAAVGRQARALLETDALVTADRGEPAAVAERRARRRDRYRRVGLP